MYAKIFLTFDVEDFINARSINALCNILKLLKKYNFTALFFITGHMAEKLCDFPEIMDLLKAHKLGYHSSSHSVRPTIPEYTDVENYEEAYLRALEREVSHVNPLTGEVEGQGGISLLRNLFPKKKIVSFRAPGGCWSPPHLDALVELGIKFDFSGHIFSIPVSYRDVTFFPNSVLIDRFNISVYSGFLSHILKDRITVLCSHPSSFVNRKAWDSIYYRANPKKIFEVQPKSWEETKSLFLRFESLLKKIKLLQEMNVVEATPDLARSKRNIFITKTGIEKAYEKSIWWSRTFFGYEPKFLRSHFFRYFMNTGARDIGET